MPDDELIVVVTDKDGNTKTLSSHEPDPGDRPQGLSHSSQVASGFYTGGFTLSWPIDQERDDIHLLDDVRFITASGDTVYEGFVAAMPRSTSSDGRGTLTITLSGYMATTAGTGFTMPFIDRDLTAWQEPSIAHRIALLAASYNPDGGQLSVAPDDTGTPGLVSMRQAPLNNPCNRYTYDAGTQANVKRIYATQTLGRFTLADANLDIRALSWTDDAGSNQLLSGNLNNSTTVDYTPTSAQRYMVFSWLYNSAATGTAGLDYSVRWAGVRVIGDHTVSTNDLASVPQGVLASDVIRWIVANHAPLLNTQGVLDTTYPIAHLVFRERTTPYDAILKVNSYHLWDLAVWEDRTLYYQQPDLSDWDWEIRHDDVGNQIGLQGDEYTQLRNGIVVQFTNVESGHQEELLPEDHAELRDDSIDNPFNQHGWTWHGSPFQVPYPTTEGNALELGRIRLLEDNQVKAPGSFTIQDQVRDRQGNLQSVSMMRSGQRIRLTSSVNLNDRPRLIHEVSYTHDSRTVTVGVDSTLRYLDAILDRTQTALAANNLT